jgi:hypothetical protein
MKLRSENCHLLKSPFKVDYGDYMKNNKKISEKKKEIEIALGRLTKRKKTKLEEDTNNFISEMIRYVVDITTKLLTNPQYSKEVVDQFKTMVSSQTQYAIITFCVTVVSSGLTELSDKNPNPKPTKTLRNIIFKQAIDKATKSNAYMSDDCDQMTNPNINIASNLMSLLKKLDELNQHKTELSTPKTNSRSTSKKSPKIDKVKGIPHDSKRPDPRNSRKRITLKSSSK